MRIFTIRRFHTWARKHELTDDLLRNAVDEIAKGLVEASLGANLYKKRIATRGRGKSGSVRTLLVFRAGQRTIYLYAFEKSQRDNIADSERRALQKLGNAFLDFTDTELALRLKDGALIEITKLKE